MIINLPLRLIIYLIKPPSPTFEGNMFSVYVYVIVSFYSLPKGILFTL